MLTWVILVTRTGVWRDRIVAGDPEYAQYADLDNWDGSPFLLTSATNDWKRFPQWADSAKRWHEYMVDLLGARAHSTLYPNGLLDGPEESESVSFDRSLHELFIVPERDQQTAEFETKAHGTEPSKWPYKPAYLPARYASMKLNSASWSRLEDSNHLPRDRPTLLDNVRMPRADWSTPLSGRCWCLLLGYCQMLHVVSTR